MRPAVVDRSAGVGVVFSLTLTLYRERTNRLW